MPSAGTWRGTTALIFKPCMGVDVTRSLTRRSRRRLTDDERGVLINPFWQFRHPAGTTDEQQVVEVFGSLAAARATWRVWGAELTRQYREAGFAFSPLGERLFGKEAE